MNTKAIIGVIILVVIIIVTWKIMSTKAPDSIPNVSVTQGASNTADVSAAVGTPLKVSQASFSFTGYGPGKEETGTFNKVEYALSKDSSGKISGAITFDNASVSTGKAMLDKHLCSPDFIDCVTYPKTVFTLTSFDAKGGIASGSLLFRGQKKDISFPVTVKGNVYSADVKLNTSLFGFKYTAIKEEIRIQFSVTLS